MANEQESKMWDAVQNGLKDKIAAASDALEDVSEILEHRRDLFDEGTEDFIFWDKLNDKVCDMVEDLDGINDDILITEGE